jgi:hypothetical protein
MDIPSERRGGTKPDDAEAREKGPWVETSKEGIVPAELGGSDAPEEMLGEDPEMRSEALGRTTGDDTPATMAGIDPDAGDHADAVTDAGPTVPGDAEPDLKDVAAASREAGKDDA